MVEKYAGAREEMAKTTTIRKPAGERAIRVVIPVELEEKVEAEAQRRGLTLDTAVRVLLHERVAELDTVDHLTHAEEWQRAQAWTSWQQIENGDVQEVSKEEIDKEFEDALRMVHP